MPGPYGPRHREYVNDSDIELTDHVTYQIAGTTQDPLKIVGTTHLDVTFQLRKLSMAMDDHNVQDFRKRKAAGELFNNPMSLTIVEEILTNQPMNRKRLAWNGMGGASGYINSGLYTCKNVIGSYLNWPNGVAPQHPDVTEEAITKAWANVQANDAMILATLGEANETVQMIYGILKTVVKMHIACRKADWKYFRGLISPKKYKDYYLGIRYGLRPLVYETIGILNTINKVERKPRLTARGKQQAKDVLEDNTTTNYQGLVVRVDRQIQQIVTARAGVLYDVDYTKLNIWGADLYLESVWELIPYSFIIDWFCNVGKLIASWTPNKGVTPLTSWVTVQTVTTQSNTIRDCWNSESGLNYANYVSWGGQRTKLTTTKVRTPNPLKPVSLHFDVKLDGFKILDLLAILSK